MARNSPREPLMAAVLLILLIYQLYSVNPSDEMPAVVANATAVADLTHRRTAIEEGNQLMVRRIAELKNKLAEVDRLPSPPAEKEDVVLNTTFPGLTELPRLGERCGQLPCPAEWSMSCPCSQPGTCIIGAARREGAGGG